MEVCAGGGGVSGEIRMEDVTQAVPIRSVSAQDNQSVPDQTTYTQETTKES